MSKKKLPALTEETWFAELAAVAKQQGAARDGFMTSAEIADAVGMNIRLVRERLKRINAAGRLECRHFPNRRVDGVIQDIPAYRIKK